MRLALAPLVALLLAGCVHDAEAGARRTVTASWYGSPQRVACGGRFSPEALTTAHRTLPCGTRIRVFHGGSSVVVEVNDRGPFVHGRQLDLSRAAARKLNMLQRGVARVDMEVLRR